MSSKTPPLAEVASSFRQIMGNTGILLGGKALNAVLSLAAIALTARTLGVETFGVLVLIHAYVQTVGEIAHFQSWQVLLNYGTAPFAEGRFAAFQRVLRFSAVLDAASAVLGVVIAIAGVWLIGAGLGWPVTHQNAVSIYALSIIFMVSATATGVLRLVDRFDLLAIQSSIESWVKLLGAGIAWHVGGDLESFLLIWLIAKVVAFVFLLGSAVKVLKKAGALPLVKGYNQGPPLGSTPGLWPFVWSTNFNSTLGLAFTQAGTLMVGALLGPREAALYRIAKQLADAVAKPAKLIVPALYPELARMVLNTDHAALRKLVLQLALTAGGIATVFLLIISVIGGPMLALIVGPEFVAAQPVMLWLLAAAVISLWGVPLEPLLMSTGSATQAFWMRLAITLAYLPLLYWMTATLGLIASGIAACIGTAALLAGQIFLSWRWFRKSAGGGSTPV